MSAVATWEPSTYPDGITLAAIVENRLAADRRPGETYVSRKAAAKHLGELANAIAVVGLYMPVRSNLIEPVLTAIDSVANNPEVCDV